ncbi:MFS transporter [Desulfospira joergensenii]|uniref:MFS transporter n=1 Tax=Desulfospira joergensenii TaxID=53329 RepID=UPI0003B2F779|nr:MFS transporter [Desulfospira joergensenii]
MIMFRKNKSTPIRSKLVMGALLLMTTALAFNAMLSLNALEKLYEASIISKYTVVGTDLKRSIERSLRFGKELGTYFGMEDILAKTLGALEKDSEPSERGTFFWRYSDQLSVSIVNRDLTVLYTTDAALENQPLPEKLFAKAMETPDKNKEETSSLYKKVKDRYFLLIPISQGLLDKEIVGVISIVFGEQKVKASLAKLMEQSTLLIVVILAVACLLLIAVLNLIPFSDSPERPLPRKKVALFLFLMIVLSQAVFIGIHTAKFKSYYLKINKEKIRVIVGLLKEDIEFFLQKGLPINKLKKMDVMLAKVIASSPELDRIAITGNTGRPLYAADQKGRIDFQENTELARYHLSGPDLDKVYGTGVVIEKDGEPQGKIIASLSKQALNKKVWATLVDSITVLIISILFFVEMMILLFQYIRGQILKGAQKQIKAVSYIAIRPVMFLFLFGMDASISFIPLHMENLYTPIPGFSKDLVMGLPISVKFFFTAICVFIGGIWVDRKGWHPPFRAGIGLAGTGFIYAFLVPGAVHFITAMAMVGAGFGLTMISSQGFVVNHVDSSRNTQGISLLFAGAYAGNICGSATGAILADRLGFPPVFAFSCMIMVITFLLALITLKESAGSPGPQNRDDVIPSKASRDGQDGLKIRQTIRFLFDKDVLCLVIFCSFPAAISIIGFMNYLCPIYLNRIGTSQSTIGRVFMIYGLCLVYLAPYIGKFVDRSGNSKKYLVISGLFGAVAFLIYQYLGHVPAVAVTIFLLGLSASYGGAPRRSYVLKLPVSKALGAGKAMGIFNSMTRIGQILGPFVFGWLILTFGIDKGLPLFGGGYLIMVVLFYFIARQDHNAKPSEG